MRDLKISQTFFVGNKFKTFLVLSDGFWGITCEQKKMLIDKRLSVSPIHGLNNYVSVLRHCCSNASQHSPDTQRFHKSIHVSTYPFLIDRPFLISKVSGERLGPSHQRTNG